jgi:hypothetical protein
MSLREDVEAAQPDRNAALVADAIEQVAQALERIADELSTYNDYHSRPSNALGTTGVPSSRVNCAPTTSRP